MLEAVKLRLFLNPGASDEIKVACDWRTTIEEIATLEKAVKDQKEKNNSVEAEFKTQAEKAKKEQTLLS